MPNYKSVRLEQHVYQELIRRIKPRESMSQVIERLINNLDEVLGHVWAITQTEEGKTLWNTKR